jgi:hypothetical protein
MMVRGRNYVLRNLRSADKSSRARKKSVSICTTRIRAKGAKGKSGRDSRQRKFEQSDVEEGRMVERVTEQGSRKLFVTRR